MEKYSWAKIKIEINKLISNRRLRKKVADVFLKSFESFLYIKIDKEH